ncbi:MAG TPA: hypothetical protein VFA27_06850 [Vicinamibacterales bacterium]|nr:hypothetical protein [Vicinamibacterales bacterium]
MNYDAPDAIPWPPDEIEPEETLFDAASDDPSADGPGDRRWVPHGFAEWFAIGLTFLPAILYLPNSQPYRLPARVGAYGISIYAFALWWFDRAGRKETHHPAERWLMMITMLLGAMIFHPQTPGILAGVAHAALYFAIFCPVFWVPAYVTSRQRLIRVLAIILLCNGLNSLVGVLQVYDPDRWMPRQLSPVFSGVEGRDALAAVTYIGPGGRPIVRPPGLFDTPGAVCSAGSLAAVLGLIFFLEPLPWWKRLPALGMAVFGMAAIYLSHVRASFVVTLAMMGLYVVLISWQRQGKRAAGFASIATAIVVASLSLATMLGGESVQERFMTLIGDDPRTTYYQARGVQVEYAFTDLVQQFPFGAGLARWGMAAAYFGSDSGGIDRDAVFAEVQPNAWILDGGWPLLILYSLALIATVGVDMRLVRTLADPADRLLASIVVATNFGTLFFLLTFVPFGTAAGMQFWFLEGALHGAMASRPRTE